jgi:hypothetical protein
MCAEFTFLFRCLPAVHCGLGGCARGQGAGERSHAAGAQVEQWRAHPQVQLRNKQKPEVFIIPLLYYLRYCTVIKIRYEAIEFLGSVAFKVLVG